MTKNENKWFSNKLFTTDSLKLTEVTYSTKTIINGKKKLSKNFIYAFNTNIIVLYFLSFYNFFVLTMIETLFDFWCNLECVKHFSD